MSTIGPSPENTVVRASEIRSLPGTVSLKSRIAPVEIGVVVTSRTCSWSGLNSTVRSIPSPAAGRAMIGMIVSLPATPRPSSGMLSCAVQPTTWALPSAPVLGTPPSLRECSVQCSGVVPPVLPRASRLIQKIVPEPASGLGWKSEMSTAPGMPML